MKLEGLWFKHYKGTEYRVESESTHTETVEEMVNYRSVGGTLWSRPREMFLGLTDAGVRRFEPLVRFWHFGPIGTIEFKRPEAIVMAEVYEGIYTLETTNDDFSVGHFGTRRIVYHPLEFTLKVQNGSHSEVPDGFFDGEFDLTTVGNGRTIKLVGCRSYDSNPLNISGTFKKIKDKSL